mgnify:CR=1 FL=1
MTKHMELPSFFGKSIHGTTWHLSSVLPREQVRLFKPDGGRATLARPHFISLPPLRRRHILICPPLAMPRRRIITYAMLMLERRVGLLERIHARHEAQIRPGLPPNSLEEDAGEVEPPTPATGFTIL